MRQNSKGRERNVIQEEAVCEISGFKWWVGSVETTVKDDCFLSEFNIPNIVVMSITKWSQSFI